VLCSAFVAIFDTVFGTDLPGFSLVASFELSVGAALQLPGAVALAKTATNVPSTILAAN
jgi:hypothetical protein